MSNIQELCKEIRKDYMEQLRDAINEIATSVRATIDCIPKEDLRDFVENNPISKMKLSWNISKNGKIFFEGYEGVRNSKIGKGYQFNSNCVESCNELLAKRNYDFEIFHMGWFNIMDNSIGLHFMVRTDLKEEVVFFRQFESDLKETFPRSRIENNILWKDGSLKRDGLITIII